MDTIEGGKWLPDQDLAWTLVTKAVERVRELENEVGCFFDRNPDGTLHQKAFAGQTFDRTVHKGDLTGIEIINRLAEQVWVAGVERLEEHRAVELVKTRDGAALAGVLLIDMREGDVRLRAGAARAARHRRRAHDVQVPHALGRQELRRARDGAARGAARCATWRWCSSIPRDCSPGRSTRMTGTVLEEGLRGAGGYLLDGAGRRFMQDYDPRGERATRDIVSRAIFAEMRAGRTTPNGGVYLVDGAPGPGQRAPRSSRAWSSAARTAASTSPAGASRSCPPRTT